jgi:hypothetical protein
MLIVPEPEPESEPEEEEEGDENERLPMAVDDEHQVSKITFSSSDFKF